MKKEINSRPKNEKLRFKTKEITPKKQEKQR
jgi:hypothetical protein